MATCIHSSRSCLPPFYTIPIFLLLNRKIFHLLVYFSILSLRGILSIGKTWNECVFEIERPAGEERNRIRGAQGRGFFAL